MTKDAVKERKSSYGKNPKRKLVTAFLYRRRGPHPSVCPDACSSQWPFYGPDFGR